VEEPFQPADELRLRHAQFGIARRVPLLERKGQPIEFVDEFRGETGLQLDDRTPVDLGQALPGLLVQGRGLHLVQQLLDHAADAHDLGRLLDQAGRVVLAAALGFGLVDLDRAQGAAVRPDHHDRARRIRAVLLVPLGLR
jgi:hypothetical protein